MVHRLKKFLLPVTCVCMLGGCVAGAAVPATAGAKAAVGISDNGPAMFTESLFTKVNITTARLVVDWNVATSLRWSSPRSETAVWARINCASSIRSASFRRCRPILR